MQETRFCLLTRQLVIATIASYTCFRVLSKPLLVQCKNVLLNELDGLQGTIPIRVKPQLCDISSGTQGEPFLDVRRGGDVTDEIIIGPEDGFSHSVHQ